MCRGSFFLLIITRRNLCLIIVHFFDVILKVNLRAQKRKTSSPIIYLHRKKRQIGYNTAYRFCEALLPRNYTQYKEICHESETKLGDGLNVLEPRE